MEKKLIVEVYYDKYNRLTVIGYQKGSKEIETKLMGNRALSFIYEISGERIKGLHKNSANSLSVVYKEALVQLHDYRRLSKEEDLKPYINILRKFEIKKENERERKVKRENKHSGKRIVAGSLATIFIAAGIIAGSSALSQLKKHKNDEEIDNDLIASYTSPSAVPLPEGPDITSYLEELDTSIFGDPSEVVADDFAYINYEDRTSTKKAQDANLLYGEMIEESAKRYGLDPNLVMAVATHERGVHSPTMDKGGATGLMQIQNGVWVGNSITAYNFELGKNETVDITEEKLADCASNINIGCMILQEMISDKDYNILAGLQSYNMGGGSVNKILANYSLASNKAREEILSDQTDCGWLEHRGIIKFGDQNYVEHVLSYMGADVNTYVFKPSGEMVELNIKNYETSKAIH